MSTLDPEVDDTIESARERVEPDPKRDVDEQIDEAEEEREERNFMDPRYCHLTVPSARAHCHLPMLISSNQSMVVCFDSVTPNRRHFWSHGYRI